jgi:hypothetical protein
MEGTKVCTRTYVESSDLELVYHYQELLGEARATIDSQQQVIEQQNAELSELRKLVASLSSAQTPTHIHTQQPQPQQTLTHQQQVHNSNTFTPPPVQGAAPGGEGNPEGELDVAFIHSIFGTGKRGLVNQTRAKSPRPLGLHINSSSGNNTSSSDTADGGGSSVTGSVAPPPVGPATPSISSHIQASIPSTGSNSNTSANSANSGCTSSLMSAFQRQKLFDFSPAARNHNSSKDKDNNSSNENGVAGNGASSHHNKRVTYELKLPSQTNITNCSTGSDVDFATKQFDSARSSDRDPFHQMLLCRTDSESTATTTASSSASSAKSSPPQSSNAPSVTITQQASSLTPITPTGGSASSVAARRQRVTKLRTNNSGASLEIDTSKPNTAGSVCSTVESYDKVHIPYCFAVVNNHLCALFVQDFGLNRSRTLSIDLPTTAGSTTTDGPMSLGPCADNGALDFTIIPIVKYDDDSNSTMMCNTDSARLDTVAAVADTLKSSLKRPTPLTIPVDLNGQSTLFIAHDNPQLGTSVAEISKESNNAMQILIECKEDRTNETIFILGKCVYSGENTNAGNKQSMLRGSQCLLMTELRAVKGALNAFPVRHKDGSDSSECIKELYLSFNDPKGYNNTAAASSSSNAVKPIVVDVTASSLAALLSNCSSRVDVMLKPITSSPDDPRCCWFPYYEGARKMAPQFRSNAVGYLRLGNDMSMFGTSFLSADGGATFIGNDDSCVYQENCGNNGGLGGDNFNGKTVMSAKAATMKAARLAKRLNGKAVSSKS